jgi:hypothetical protein
VGSSTYRRDLFDLAVHAEDARLFLGTNSPAPVYAQQGELVFAQARWTRTKDMPTRGNWVFMGEARQSIPGLSAYPLQELHGLAQWTYTSSGGRQRLLTQLDGRVGRSSSWGGQNISGLSVRPTLMYEFRIADDALPGLWPAFYLDRIEGRVLYQYQYNSGTPLYQASGHTIIAEIENKGYITKLIPYDLRLGVRLQSQLGYFRPDPYVEVGLNLAQF